MAEVGTVGSGYRDGGEAGGSQRARDPFDKLHPTDGGDLLRRPEAQASPAGQNGSDAQ